MDQVISALWATVAAAILAAAPIVLRVALAYAELLRQRGWQVLQERLGEGAARIAAEIAAQVAGSPGVQAASRAMVETGALMLRARFEQEVARRGVPLATIEGMLTGELGKRGVVVQR
ncbi:MAG: hypothetical protein F2563_04105 [Actinobacteria bacterium]|uniref:Unannotated protein n=1 Tax=freshwater metagenome TaxID=449393 RepID=A0A6J6ES24_9ZZZZ|nr:hypothetical protein [Actinomycetota bacterium]